MTKSHAGHALHLIHSLDFGGTETQLRLIAEAQGRRFEHSFCAFSAGGNCYDAINRAGAKSHLLGIDAWSHPVTAILKLRTLIGRLRPDVVHCHAADANLFGLMASWTARSPVRLGEEVGIPNHGTKARLAYRLAYRTADRIIAVSDAVAQRIIELGEAPPAKIVRIYNPVRLPLQQAKVRRSGEPLRIACVGRLEPWKNPMALVAAAAELRDLELEILLIGDGSQRAEVEAETKRLEVQDRVRLCGLIDGPETLLAECHLYVQPSPSEGFGIALAEAMGCSLPVIASATSGAREFIRDQENGWLLPDVRAQTIASAIRCAAAMDPAILAKMGNSAREQVEGRFDPDRYVAELENLYAAILRRKRRS